jgi:hypothetical protein
MGQEVLVFCGDEGGVRQPDTFRCCPLGLQFYSPKELPSYQVLEFKVKAPSDAAAGVPVDCSGVVVHSQYEDKRGMYRVWVAFLDLDEGVRRGLECFAKDAKLTCPHCMNYSVSP